MSGITTPPKAWPTRSPRSSPSSTKILLHVSRGVRWDSDHVIILNDDLLGIAQELVRGNYLSRTTSAWIISMPASTAWRLGHRHAQYAARPLCGHAGTGRDPEKLEENGDYTSRLALMEELKTMPAGAVWDYYCARQSVPIGTEWMAEVKKYEANVQSKRK